MTDTAEHDAARQKYFLNEQYLYAIAEQLDTEQLLTLMDRCHQNDAGVPEDILSSLTVQAQDILRCLMASGRGRIQVASAVGRELREQREVRAWREQDTAGPY